MVVDHGLPGFAILGAAQKQTAVRSEVVVHFQRDFEIPKWLVGNYNAAIARNILAAHDGAVFDDPPSARLIFTGAAVTGLAADVPTRERLAVEDGNESVRVGRLCGWFCP
jgi:hypothetical protein